MTDDEQKYHALLRAMTKAIDILQEAQKCDQPTFVESKKEYENNMLTKKREEYRE